MSDSPKRYAPPRLLESVSFPTDKVALLERAKELDTPDALRQAIGRLRPGIIHSREDLIAAIEAVAT